MTVIGSMLGNIFGKTGLFTGAIVGGIIGILVVMILARRFNLIEARHHVSTLIGATSGYLIAAVIARDAAAMPYDNATTVLAFVAPIWIPFALAPVVTRVVVRRLAAAAVIV